MTWQIVTVVVGFVALAVQIILWLHIECSQR